ncbi:RHS repeat-associated core domain-containing protein [Aestuariibacter sp. AA17]|uniref:RHS repeat-associated core domain-containing protein n=1 Tax=Fluctibacter corallii TaxID=2984329 RepID=A0ABT3ACR5_9ALTE|nr:RHS repeat-associated core domain-containing protein [Aestuariibacter sp. AA17]MCV2886474.1 RHS repeat-associated core domain-containing protein [Aestuariibacter sp. AA17]
MLYQDTPAGGVNNIYLGSKLIAKDGFIPNPGGTQNHRPYGSSIEGEADDIGYTGHKFDTDLGLSYMQARYYDPVIGRFYSNDPVDVLEHMGTHNGIHGFNRYAYANNNPYKYTDPDGREVRVAHVSPGFGLGAAGHTFLGSGNKAYSTAINISGVGTGDFDSAVQSYLDSGRDATMFTLEGSDSQTMESVVNAILADYDPGAYFPIGNNCSDMVIDVLNEAGAMEGNTSVMGKVTPNGTANSLTSVSGYMTKEFESNKGSGLVKGIQVHRVSGRIESKKLESH